jgi:hypothetical protein
MPIPKCPAGYKMPRSIIPSIVLNSTFSGDMFEIFSGIAQTGDFIFDVFLPFPFAACLLVHLAREATVDSLRHT